jgi:hypothetical protein
MLRKQSRQMARTHAGDLGQLHRGPIRRRILGDSILNAMHRRMQMIAMHDPRRQRRIGT